MKHGMIKKLITITLLLTVIPMMLTTFSSCSSLGFGTAMPDLEAYQAFENDTWLVIDHFLVNKKDGTVCLMKANTDAPVPSGVWDFYYYGPYAYKYVFEESSFDEYTFLETSSTESGETLFCECIMTYSYQGAELERSYIGEPLTEEQMAQAYKTNPSNVATFCFEVDVLWQHQKQEYADAQKQDILHYVEELYQAQSDKSSAVVGLAKPMGEDVWFSTVVSKDGDFNSGEPLFGGILQSKICRYDSGTGEITTVFAYNQSGKQIVDFDQNGMYVLDSDGKLCYVDFKSNESVLIHDFSGRVYSIHITDQYLCAVYGSGGSSYFVYQKGGSVIAADAY